VVEERRGGEVERRVEGKVEGKVEGVFRTLNIDH
jgi:hypothetical protein